MSGRKDVRHRAIVGLPGCQFEAHRAAFSIDQGVDLRRQAATGPPYAVVPTMHRNIGPSNCSAQATILTPFFPFAPCW